jgi:hypothetical protein
MYCLSEEQIGYILSDIRRRGVEMEDLQLNLLDHICCIVEQNLKEGEDFEAFYSQTIPRFFKHELWEIEQETITLLTFKDYYAMKKAMIICGSLSVAAFLTGSFFKIMYWPGANVLLLLAIILFTFLFLPMLFVVKSRDTHNWQDKLLTGTSVLAGMLYATSSLFAVMHWPYRTPLWIITSAFSLFVLIPSYFFTNFRKEGNKINTIITTIILTGATGVLFLMISLRPSKQIELCNFYSNQDLAATARFLTTENASLYQAISDTNSKARALTELRKKSNTLYEKIEQLKLDMINALDGRNDKVVDYSSLFSGQFTGHVRSTRMLFNENAEAIPRLKELKQEIEDFDACIKRNFNIDSFSMINTSGSVEMDSDGSIIPWENFNFYKVPFDMVLRNLTQIQVDVRSVEAVCLK